MAILQLYKRVAALPENLRDHIRDYVFTPDTKTVIIDKSYKPPAQLQVSHATRERAADAYYRNTTFQIVENLEDLWLENWLPSLLKAHLALIHSFYYKIKPKDVARSRKSAVSLAWKQTEPLWVLATTDGHFVQPQDIFTNVKYTDEHGIVQEVIMDGDSITEEWNNGGPVYAFTLSTPPGIRGGGSSGKIGKEKMDEQDAKKEDGTQKKNKKKHKPKKKSNKPKSEPVEEKKDHEKAGMTRFASKNAFASLESWGPEM